MKLLNNRRFAAVVLVVVALGSIFGFGGSSLANQRRQVEAVFNDGTDPSLGAHVLSMDAYLDNSAEYAGNMVHEYRKYATQDSESVSQLEQLAGVIGNGSDYDARYTAYVAFLEKVEALYSEFNALGVSEDEARSFNSAYRNIVNDENDKIKRDGYHQAAEGFNAVLKGFPASLIGKVLGVKAMNTFDGEAVR